VKTVNYYIVLSNGVLQFTVDCKLFIQIV